MKLHITTPEPQIKSLSQKWVSPPELAIMPIGSATAVTRPANIVSVRKIHIPQSFLFIGNDTKQINLKATDRKNKIMEEKVYPERIVQLLGVNNIEVDMKEGELFIEERKGEGGVAIELADEELMTLLDRFTDIDFTPQEIYGVK